MIPLEEFSPETNGPLQATSPENTMLNFSMSTAHSAVTNTNATTFCLTNSKDSSLYLNQLNLCTISFSLTVYMILLHLSKFHIGPKIEIMEQYSMPKEILEHLIT